MFSVEGLQNLEGDFANLDWTGVQMVEEDFRPNPDGTFLRQRFYRNATWMKRDTAFAVLPVNASGFPVGLPLVAEPLRLEFRIDPATYAGFNLVVGDLRTRSWAWIGNRDPLHPHQLKAPRLHTRALGAGDSATCTITNDDVLPSAINLVAKSWGAQHIGEGDEIIVSNLEHHANIVPWQQLAAAKGAKLRVIPVDDSGQVLLDEYQKLLNDRTKIVSVTQVSNALGTVVPVKEIVALAHRAGAMALVDGAQSISHMRVDVQDIGADFFVFSGH